MVCKYAGQVVKLILKSIDNCSAARYIKINW